MEFQCVSREQGLRNLPWNKPYGQNLFLFCEKKCRPAPMLESSDLLGCVLSGNAVAWNRVTSLRLLLSSFIFPPQLLRGAHPVCARLALGLGERLRLALGEPAQCLCVLVHWRDSKQSARLVNHHGAGRNKREGVSCRTTNPGSRLSLPTIPPPLEILSSHLAASATLSPRP